MNNQEQLNNLPSNAKEIVLVVIIVLAIAVIRWDQVKNRDCGVSVGKG